MNRFRNPRRSILDLLVAVLGRKAPFEEAFAEDPGIASFDPRDRAFVYNFVATTLRHLGEIDALIDHVLEKPLPQKAAIVRDVLRIGIAQLCFLKTPPHAAVDSSVELLHATPFAFYKGLVNAVLRRLSQEGTKLLRSYDAAHLNTPAWLWESWQHAYGEEICREIALAHLRKAPLDFTFRQGMEDFAAKLDATLLPTGSFRLHTHGSIDALPGYGEGIWWVQDAAAAIPAKLFGNVEDAFVLDLCAAPGGKAAQLADHGARVIAIDRSPSRLGLLHENLARLHLDAQTIEADATDWKPEQPAPFVLLDAPCSATGTIRRHPDIAWQKTPDDIKKLAVIQDALLQSAVAMMADDGILVYAVCSLQPEEAEKRIEALLAKGAPLVRLPIEPDEVGGIGELLTPVGDLRTLPSHLDTLGGMDGFYAARLRKLR